MLTAEVLVAMNTTVLHLMLFADAVVASQQLLPEGAVAAEAGCPDLHCNADISRISVKTDAGRSHLQPSGSQTLSK